MAIQYASGTRINSLTTITSKATLMAALDTALTGAGWTVTTTTSSTDKIYRSVATPQGNQIKVRIWDSGGTCLRLRMMNTAQTLAQVDSCYLAPTTSIDYRIIANQYQFLAFVPGSISPRNFVIASALYIPPFLSSFGLTTSAVILGDGGGDTDTTQRGGFRTSLTTRGLVGYAPSQGWTILNSTAVEYSALTADSSAHPGLPALVGMQSAAMHSVGGWKWHDDSAFIIDTLIGWGTPTVDNEFKVRGQLWDSVIATDSYPADTTTGLDSHTYYLITDNNAGNATLPASMRGSLCVVSV